MSDPLFPLHTSVPGAATYPLDSTGGVAGATGGVATPGSGAATSTPLPGQASQYAGSAQVNKFAATGGGSEGGFAQAQAAGQQAGLPYVSDANLSAANAKTQGSGAREVITQAVLNPATTAEGRAKQVQQVSAAMVDPVYSGISPMTIAMLALYDSQNQKDKDLAFAQNRLSMYQVMSKKMADYSSYLQGVQHDLDAKTATKKDKDKPNADVLVKQQLDFTADSMVSLDKDGAYNVKNLAEGKSDKSNMVTASSLTTRLQLFSQQRDLLQKNIDKWTTQYQNGLQQKNNLAQTVSQLIKDVRDANMGTIHNI